MSAGGAQTSSRRRKGLQSGLPDDQPDYHAVISGVYAQNNTNPPLRMDCSVHIQRRVTQVISHAPIRPNFAPHTHAILSCVIWARTERTDGIDSRVVFPFYCH